MTQTQDTREAAPLAAPATGRSRRLGIALAVAVAAVGGVLIARSALRGEPVAAAAATTRDVPHLDGKWIRFSEQFADRAHIEIAAAEHAALTPLVSVTGTVTFDPERVSAVGARIDGRVRKVFKYPGDLVARGDVLAEIESAELGSAQSAVAAARAHADAARANERREVQLAESRVSSQRDAELAHAGAVAAEAELRAAEQKVRALGASRSPEVGVLGLTSPIAGKVVESHVSRGQFVEPTQTLFRVADIGRVWIELAVFERAVNYVRPGDSVEITPQSNGSVTLKGTVAHVGDVIDLDSRTADVRVVVDNPDGALRPGQSVVARIRTSAAPTGALVLPLDAVTSVDGHPTVFVAHDATAVEPRAITLGGRDATRVEVTSGLSPDDRVVVQGVFALKAELFR